MAGPHQDLSRLHGKRIGFVCVMTGRGDYARGNPVRAICLILILKQACAAKCQLQLYKRDFAAQFGLLSY